MNEVIFEKNIKQFEREFFGSKVEWKETRNQLTDYLACADVTWIYLQMHV